MLIENASVILFVTLTAGHLSVLEGSDRVRLIRQSSNDGETGINLPSADLPSDPAELQCDPGRSLHIVGFTPLGGTEVNPIVLRSGTRCSYLDKLQSGVATMCNGLNRCTVDMAKIHAVKRKCNDTGVTLVSIDVYCEPSVKAGTSRRTSPVYSRKIKPAPRALKAHRRGNLRKSVQKLFSNPRNSKVKVQSSKGKSNPKKSGPTKGRPTYKLKTVARSKQTTRKRPGAASTRPMGAARKKLVRPHRYKKKKIAKNRSAAKHRMPKKALKHIARKQLLKIARREHANTKSSAAAPGTIPVKIGAKKKQALSINIHKARSGPQFNVRCRKTVEGPADSFICHHRGRLPQKILDAIQSDSYIIVTGTKSGKNNSLVFIQREGRLLGKDMFLNLLHSNDLIRGAASKENAHRRRNSHKRNKMRKSRRKPVRGAASKKNSHRRRNSHKRNKMRKSRRKPVRGAASKKNSHRRRNSHKRNKMRKSRRKPVRGAASKKNSHRRRNSHKRNKMRKSRRKSKSRIGKLRNNTSGEHNSSIAVNVTDITARSKLSKGLSKSNITETAAGNHPGREKLKKPGTKWKSSTIVKTPKKKTNPFKPNKSSKGVRKWSKRKKTNVAKERKPRFGRKKAAKSTKRSRKKSRTKHWSRRYAKALPKKVVKLEIKMEVTERQLPARSKGPGRVKMRKMLLKRGSLRNRLRKHKNLIRTNRHKSLRKSSTPRHRPTAVLVPRRKHVKRPVLHWISGARKETKHKQDLRKRNKLSSATKGITRLNKAKKSPRKRKLSRLPNLAGKLRPAAKMRVNHNTRNSLVKQKDKRTKGRLERKKPRGNQMMQIKGAKATHEVKTNAVKSKHKNAKTVIPSFRDFFQTSSVVDKRRFRRDGAKQKEEPFVAKVFVDDVTVDSRRHSNSRSNRLRQTRSSKLRGQWPRMFVQKEKKTPAGVLAEIDLTDEHFAVSENGLLQQSERTDPLIRVSLNMGSLFSQKGNSSHKLRKKSSKNATRRRKQSLTRQSGTRRKTAKLATSRFKEESGSHRVTDQRTELLGKRLNAETAIILLTDFPNTSVGDLHMNEIRLENQNALWQPERNKQEPRKQTGGYDELSMRSTEDGNKHTHQTDDIHGILHFLPRTFKGHLNQAELVELIRTVSTEAHRRPNAKLSPTSIVKLMFLMFLVKHFETKLRSSAVSPGVRQELHMANVLPLSPTEVTNAKIVYGNSLDEGSASSTVLSNSAVPTDSNPSNKSTARLGVSPVSVLLAGVGSNLPTNVPSKMLHQHQVQAPMNAVKKPKPGLSARAKPSSQMKGKKTGIITAGKFAGIKHGAFKNRGPINKTSGGGSVATHQSSKVAHQFTKPAKQITSKIVSEKKKKSGQMSTKTAATSKSKPYPDAAVKKNKKTKGFTQVFSFLTRNATKPPSSFQESPAKSHGTKTQALKQSKKQLARPTADLHHSIKSEPAAASTRKVLAGKKLTVLSADKNSSYLSPVLHPIAGSVAAGDYETKQNMNLIPTSKSEHISTFTGRHPAKSSSVKADLALRAGQRLKPMNKISPRINQPQQNISASLKSTKKSAYTGSKNVAGEMVRGSHRSEVHRPLDSNLRKEKEFIVDAPRQKNDHHVIMLANESHTKSSPPTGQTSKLVQQYVKRPELNSRKETVLHAEKPSGELNSAGDAGKLNVSPSVTEDVHQLTHLFNRNGKNDVKNQRKTVFKSGGDMMPTNEDHVATIVNYERRPTNFHPSAKDSRIKAESRSEKVQSKSKGSKAKERPVKQQLPDIELKQAISREADVCKFANPCQNNGTCQTASGGLVCVCLPGFAGPTCEYAVDRCRPNPCQNGAQCVRSKSISGFSCNCAQEFKGLLCEVRRNPCEFVICQNRGRCVVDDAALDRFRCVCEKGFVGARCEQDATAVGSVPNMSQPIRNGCTPGAAVDDCMNGGTCRKLNETTTECSCRVGFVGHRCQYRAFQCEQSVCRNDGTCMLSPMGRAHCHCSPMFTGSLCQQPVAVQQLQCDRKPCSADPGAVCTNDPTSSVGFRCTCGPGRSGDRCDIAGDPCGFSDEAAANPCLNSGICLPLPGNGQAYHCLCTRHYIGRNCDVPVVRCGTLVCLNGGVCSTPRLGSRDLLLQSRYQDVTQDDDNAVCKCPASYYGRHCESRREPCRNQPCMNGGMCKQTTNSEGFVCVCRNSFTGKLCEKESSRFRAVSYVDVHPHLVPSELRPSTPTAETLIVDEKGAGNCGRAGICANGGSCFLAESGRRICICPRGFGGERCEIANAACTSNPCLNGASCYNSGSGLFRCVCQPGFSGSRCDIGPTVCGSPSPCLNNGVCRPARTTAGYTCVCPIGYGGLACELHDPCLSRPCLNGAECSVLPNANGLSGSGSAAAILSPESASSSFRCRCAAGFTGQLCEVDRTSLLKPEDWTGCSSKPCRAGSTCRLSTTGRNGFVCVCPLGVKGKLCEIDSKNDCRLVPCRNGGVCFDQPGGFNCSCPDGYHGITCEIKLFSDPCDQKPCNNGGRCKMIDIRSYECLCAALFTGSRCDIKRDVCSSNSKGSRAVCRDDQICAEDPTDFETGFICVDKRLQTQNSQDKYNWKFVDTASNSKVHGELENNLKRENSIDNLPATVTDEKRRIQEVEAQRGPDRTMAVILGALLAVGLVTTILIVLMLSDKYCRDRFGSPRGSHLYHAVPTSDSMSRPQRPDASQHDPYGQLMLSPSATAAVGAVGAVAANKHYGNVQQSNNAQWRRRSGEDETNVNRRQSDSYLTDGDGDSDRGKNLPDKPDVGGVNTAEAAGHIFNRERQLPVLLRLLKSGVHNKRRYELVSGSTPLTTIEEEDCSNRQYPELGKCSSVGRSAAVDVDVRYLFGGDASCDCTEPISQPFDYIGKEAVIWHENYDTGQQFPVDNSKPDVGVVESGIALRQSCSSSSSNELLTKPFINNLNNGKGVLVIGADDVSGYDFDETTTETTNSEAVLRFSSSSLNVNNSSVTSSMDPISYRDAALTRLTETAYGFPWLEPALPIQHNTLSITVDKYLHKQALRACSLPAPACHRSHHCKMLRSATVADAEGYETVELFPVCASVEPIDLNDGNDLVIESPAVRHCSAGNVGPFNFVVSGSR